jgi:AcrR family transcriptional regulator
MTDINTAPDGFARRRMQSQEDIRNAAWELFGQFGVEKVSVQDIARKANVSHATIYNNFGSKDVLVREYVAAMIEQLREKTLAVLTPEMPFQKKMAALAAFLTSNTLWSNLAGGSNPVFSASGDLLNDPEIRKLREAAQEHLIELLLEIVAQGKREGAVEPSLSEAALGIYFNLYMEAFTDPALVRQLSSDPEILRDLGKLMLRGLSIEPDSGSPLSNC